MSQAAAVIGPRWSRFLAEARRRDVGVLARVPLASGLLTGKMSKQTAFAASDHRLFNRHGFDCVTIEQIMENAGLTHGGFYRHFASKGDLYAEVLDCFFTNPDWDCGWEGADVDPAYGQLGPQIVRTYLSRAHLEEIENACPMVALPSDVARGGAHARKAYQTAFEAMVEILQQGSQNDVLPNRKRRCRGRRRSIQRMHHSAGLSQDEVVHEFACGHNGLGP